MTLPLRRKRQTTRQSIAKRQTNSAKRRIDAAKRQISVAFFAIAFLTTPPAVFAADGNWGSRAPAKLTWRPARSASNDTTIIQAVDVSPVRTAKYEEDVFDNAPATPTRIKLTAGNAAAVRTV